MSRRALMRNLGFGALATAASLALPSMASAHEGGLDVDILNFALNLEYLEAEFYSFALDGFPIPASDTTGTVGTPGPTTGGSRVPFVTPLVLNTGVEINADELAHVRLLRQLLGSAAIAKPAINLNAMGIGFANENQFLLLSRALEDVGVSAYGGAAPFIENHFRVGVAARILATEAYHAGNIRLHCIARGLAVFQLDAKDQVPTSLNFFPTDAAGLSVVRTIPEVLNLVNPFFPQGLNGNIR